MNIERDYRASIDNALRDARRQRNAALRRHGYLVLAVMAAAMVVVVAIGGGR